MESINEQLKSSSSPSSEDDQMAMMMMQLPEFDGAVEGFPPPENQFYGAAYNNNHTRSSTSTMQLADLIDNNNPPMPWSYSSSFIPSTTTNTISFANNNNHQENQERLQTQPVPEKRNNSMAAMREMIFRIAAMQPINIDPETVKPPKRRNVKISKDPQSVAARHRRERISERIRILQRLVPGGTKMDTASMLDEAIHYVKFLKGQVQSLQRAAAANNNSTVAASGIGFPVAMSSGTAAAATYLPLLPKPYLQARKDNIS